MRSKIKFYSLSFFIIFWLGFANSYANSYADEKVFHRGNYDEPDTLDPQKAYAAPDYNILQDLYEGLMTYDEHGDITYGQAESHVVSEDKKKYTFTLKQNLKWSNGDTLTANDFEFGIKRTFDPTLGSQNTNLVRIIHNADKILAGELPVNELGVKALNSQQLEIKLEHPVPYLLGLLAHNVYMPVYKPNLLRYKDGFTAQGIYVTNGPFKLYEWVVNSHLTLAKNTNFRAANEIKLNKVIFYPVNQPSVELQRYRAGDLDFTAKVPAESMKLLKSKFPEQLIVSPMLAAYYYTFNVTKPPFKDNRSLRKALELAINKKIIAEKILSSSRSATNNFVPPNIANFPKSSVVDNNEKNDQLSEQKRIELAKRYLVDSGFKPSNTNKIKLLYHTNETNKLIATAIAAMWKKNLNLNVELVNQEWKVFLKTRAERKETEVFREGWIASYNDATSFLDLFLSDNPQNSSGYFNPTYDNLLYKANLEIDQQARGRLLQQAEQILLDDAPIIPIYTPKTHHLVKQHVKGLYVNLFDGVLDRYVSIVK